MKIGGTDREEVLVRRLVGGGAAAEKATVTCIAAAGSGWNKNFFFVSEHLAANARANRWILFFFFS